MNIINELSHDITNELKKEYNDLYIDYIVNKLGFDEKIKYILSDIILYSMNDFITKYMIDINYINTNKDHNSINILYEIFIQISFIHDKPLISLEEFTVCLTNDIMKTFKKILIKIFHFQETFNDKINSFLHQFTGKKLWKARQYINETIISFSLYNKMSNNSFTRYINSN